jgi:Ca2+-binding RTX toxin-like protein
VNWTAKNAQNNETQSGSFTVTSAGDILINPTISFNEITFTAVGGKESQNRFQISHASYSVNVLPQDQNLNFVVQAVDNDGDTTASASLGVHVVAAAADGNFTSTHSLVGSNDVNDVIGASSKTDVVDGKSGFDIVDYSDSVGAISINLDNNGDASGSSRISGGNAAGDSLKNIEGIRGGQDGDTLSGNSSANSLYGNGGSDTLDGEDGDDLLDGGAGIDTLIGGDGDDILIGGAGNDILTGGDDDDILIGGFGNDTLTGGSGDNTFVFAETGLANRDTISDYTVGDDTIDLSALLDAALIDSANVGNYVQVDSTGTHSVLQVDLDGAANGANWTDVATLNNRGTIGTEIDIKIDMEEFTIKVI